MKAGLGRWILVFLILLAFGRGVWALGGKSLWWDESLSLHRAKGSVAYVLSNQITLSDNVNSVETVDNHPPLYFLLLWAAVRLAGQSEFTLRFLSLASVVLLVPLLYVTGRRLVDEWAGLAAAALGALSPMYLWYGQEARMYAMLAFVGLLSFYCFIRAFFHSPRLLDLRRQWCWLLAYLVTSVGVVLIHYLGMLLIAFELLALAWILLRQAGSRRAVALTMAVIVIILLPLLAYALVVLPSGDDQPGFGFVPLPVLLRDLLNSFSLGLSVDVGQWYILFVDLVFLLFLVSGLVFLVRRGAPRRWRAAGLLLTGYLLIPVVLIFLLSFARPAYMNSRHLISVTPPFYLLVGTGLTRWRGRSLGIALLGALLMLAGVAYSTWNYFNEPAYDKDHHREWGAYLREQVRPGDVVVVDPPHIAELYDYYASSDVPWMGLPLLGGSRRETEAMLQDLRARYDRIWLAFSHTPPWGDRRRLPESWLNEHAYRVDFQPVHSYASNVLVAGYLPDWPSVDRLPPDAQPIEVRYNPSLRLAGHRLVSPAQSGKRLHVQLYWAVDDFVPEEASVLLRLVDDMGHVWTQEEQCPFNGLYPMWQWQPGLLLQDEYEMMISPGTPPGGYQLEVMLISRPSEAGCPGERGGPIPPATAPSHANRGDRVLLGEVDVQRADLPPSLDELGIENRQRARFDGLELVGSHVTPTELKPGERLGISLYWQAKGAPLSDAQFRLRLVDASGQVQVEAVIRPAGATHPADRWQSGDRYRGQFWLYLPEDAAPGRHRLELVPESPLQQKGLVAALRRLAGGAESGLRLALVEVHALPGQAPAAPAAPILPPADLVVSHPMTATLGDRVRFLGYDIESDAVRAGELVEFTLYWQALRPMNISYNVFTHLLGPSNQILGQKDGVPRNGGYPTTLWQPGEVVADPYAFTVEPDAPPGDHPLEVGIYQLETDTRLPVVDGDGQPVPHDRILLPPVTVLPALTPTPAPHVEYERIFLPLLLKER